MNVYLEQLIIEGTAFYQTAVVGVGGISSISIPQNKQAYIVGFDYYHFTDQDNGVDPIEGLRARSVHQLVIRSTKSENTWWIRNDIFNTVSQEQGPPTDSMQVLGRSPYKDLLLLHEHTIFFEISVVLQPGRWITATAVIPAQKNGVNPAAPIGYGQELTTFGGVQPSVLTPDLASPTFAGRITENPKGIAQGYGELRNPINVNTVPIFPPANNWAARMYPIINVQYVLVNKRTDQRSHSTS